MHITFVYSDIKDYERLKGESIKGSPLFTFIDDQSLKGKKEAFSLKGHWCARLSPFAVCCKGDTPIKVFYSEAGDVVSDLVQFLNNT